MEPHGERTVTTITTRRTHLRNFLPRSLLLLSLSGLCAGAAAQEAPSFYNGFDVEGGLIAPNEIDHGGPGRDGIPCTR